MLLVVLESPTNQRTVTLKRTTFRHAVYPLLVHQDVAIHEDVAKEKELARFGLLSTELGENTLSDEDATRRRQRLTGTIGNIVTETKPCKVTCLLQTWPELPNALSTQAIRLAFASLCTARKQRDSQDSLRSIENCQSLVLRVSSAVRLEGAIDWTLDPILSDCGRNISVVASYRKLKVGVVRPRNATTCRHADIPQTPTHLVGSN